MADPDVRAVPDQPNDSAREAARQAAAEQAAARADEADKLLSALGDGHEALHDAFDDILEALRNILDRKLNLAELPERGSAGWADRQLLKSLVDSPRSGDAIATAQDALASVPYDDYAATQAAHHLDIVMERVKQAVRDLNAPLGNAEKRESLLLALGSTSNAQEAAKDKLNEFERNAGLSKDRAEEEAALFNEGPRTADAVLGPIEEDPTIAGVEPHDRGARPARAGSDGDPTAAPVTTDAITAGHLPNAPEGSPANPFPERPPSSPFSPAPQGGDPEPSWAPVQAPSSPFDSAPQGGDPHPEGSAPQGGNPPAEGFGTGAAPLADDTVMAGQASDPGAEHAHPSPLTTDTTTVHADPKPPPTPEQAPSSPFSSAPQGGDPVPEGLGSAPQGGNPPAEGFGTGAAPLPDDTVMAGQASDPEAMDGDHAAIPASDPTPPPPPEPPVTSGSEVDLLGDSPPPGEPPSEPAVVPPDAVTTGTVECPPDQGEPDLPPP